MDVFPNKFSQYLCDANDATFFKLVKDTSDLESSDGFFHPDMSHQIFGEKEQIFGYHNLRINIYYSASFLHACLQISYTKKIDPKQSEGVEADNIRSKLKDVLPRDVCTSIDDFSLILQKESLFKPFGELIDSYTRRVRGTSVEQNFEIYKADPTVPKFLEYHARMESFILWFIDAASCIDVDDDKWNFYLVFEKIVEDTKTRHTFVGYSTCYRFYAYPDKFRPRISQVLVLPPYQRQGHCSSLIQAIYSQYVSRSDVIDITAEDPSENFQRVRDFVDVQSCSTLKEFSPSSLHSPFTRDMEKAAKDKFKINKRQARRVYEILRLQNTDVNDDLEFTKYRLAIKARINQPMQQLRKKCPFISQNSMLLPTLEERHALLQREFESCVEEYAKVITRLESS